MSFEVTASSAFVIALSKSSYVRADVERKNYFILDQQFSNGENSGEYGDK